MAVHQLPPKRPPASEIPSTVKGRSKRKKQHPALARRNKHLQAKMANLEQPAAIYLDQPHARWDFAAENVSAMRGSPATADHITGGQQYGHRLLARDVQCEGGHSYGHPLKRPAANPGVSRWRRINVPSRRADYRCSARDAFFVRRRQPKKGLRPGCSIRRTSSGRSLLFSGRALVRSHPFINADNTKGQHCPVQSSRDRRQ